MYYLYSILLNDTVLIIIVIAMAKCINSTRNCDRETRDQSL